VTEGVRREGRCERGGRKERGFLHQKGGELEQEVGVLIAGERGIVEKATLRRRQWGGQRRTIGIQ
jgi:hypothetical protein